ncbi:MAG: cobalamin-dependent protein [Tissierellales bacterium]|nr:cobalamin-dependent protein [Tissierellales bacterium]MBN2828280.1 cobalamin-dependent protein [Tissierellales bacterium]
MMEALLVKCHKKTIFSKIEPIVCEPLELEYLAAALHEKNIACEITDALLDGRDFHQVFKESAPDILILSGYITAVPVVLEYARFAKSINQDVVIVVGGVHAELNCGDFFDDSIDFIIHQSNVHTFYEWVDYLKNDDKNPSQLSYIKGLAYKIDTKWHVNVKNPMISYDWPMPDRSFFNRYKNKTKFMLFREVALIRTAVSCPYACEFCCCRNINEGHYLQRDMEDVLTEITNISSTYIWIVDDTFLIDTERISKFIEGIKARGIHKKFMAYGRVDFIADNPQLIPQLKEAGFIEIIAGIENPSNSKLIQYKKGTTENNNDSAIRLLKFNNIRLTPLFIADIDFTSQDFYSLKRWIQSKRFDYYTVSVMTPIKGTKLFEKHSDAILTQDLSQYDFMHLVMKPKNMGKLRFYCHFYSFYLDQIFRSRFVRKFMFRKWIKGDEHVQ